MFHQIPLSSAMVTDTRDMFFPSPMSGTVVLQNGFNTTSYVYYTYIMKTAMLSSFIYLAKVKQKLGEILKLDPCGLTSVFVYFKSNQLLEQFSKGCDRL